MPDHDPICERRLKAYGTYRCTCTEIREARAEQNERIAQAVEALPWHRKSSHLIFRRDAARLARNGGRDV